MNCSLSSKNSYVRIPYFYFHILLYPFNLVYQKQLQNLKCYLISCKCFWCKWRPTLFLRNFKLIKYMMFLFAIYIWPVGTQTNSEHPLDEWHNWTSTQVEQVPLDVEIVPDIREQVAAFGSEIIGARDFNIKCTYLQNKITRIPAQVVADTISFPLWSLRIWQINS